LLVEDNPSDIDLTRESLEEAPYEEAPRPDLILLDLNLPREDGREVLEECKADESLRKIPVVVLTSSEAESDSMRAYDLHDNSYVVKPVGLDQFIEIMERIGGFWLRVVALPEAE
jgi:CheY-like chemotaxis protein